MRQTITFAFAFAVFAAQAFAQPQPQGTHYRYRWTDPHGIVQYADSPTAEALQAGYDVIDGRGIVIKHVDRVKTAEEKKADANAASALAQEKQRAEDAEHADQQLLQAYSSEAALIDAQSKRIAAIDQDIANVKVSEANQEKSLAEQLAYASTFERDGKPVPAPVKQQIETLRINVENQKHFVATKLAQRADSEHRAQTELAHYRDLRAAQARESGQP
jgi:hypothetical protein